MTTSTLTSKGQTTIPIAIRRHLKLSPGDRMEFVIDADGRVVMLPVTVDLKTLKGCLPKPAKPLSVDDMDRAISAGASAR
jgi:AbrB family looped-hinge helix DNA binding protein